MFSSLLSITLFSLALGATASSHGPAHHRRHDAIAAQVNSTNSTTQLHRRGETFSNARLTYYAVGLGACGEYNQPNDFSYGGGYPGPNCKRPIEITYNGKVANAVIMDECPGCPSPGGLDLSEGLFSYLASLDEGVLYASWRYTDEGDDPAPTTTKTTSSKWVAPTTSSEWVAPTTTSKKHTTSTSTWVAPTSTWSSSSEKWSSSSSYTPSSSWTPSSSSTSSTHSSSSVASSSSAAPSVSASAAALTTPTGPDTLANLNQAFLGLAEIVIAGAQAA
ncbi:hypothetical protein C2E23DRAFT_867565 [Lenzites betulinus]|nr:hypothetical protein C2E23DRAFT_867565 [Lenzites betulinus]